MYYYVLCLIILLIHDCLIFKVYVTSLFLEIILQVAHGLVPVRKLLKIHKISTKIINECSENFKGM